MRAIAFAVLALLLLAPLTAGAPSATAIERVYDANGRLLEERGDVDGFGYVKRYFWAAASDASTTDCASTAYRATPWRWSAPYTVHAAAYAGEIAAALATWDAQTSAALAGSVVAGRAGAAGARDGVNQIEWTPLSTTGTIAVTTTWYNRFTGLAVESDAQYNTHYAWATDGRAGAMDVQNIATHELGHTLGLDHPKGKSVGCLTMYAYASLGETQKRTLGEGDVRGIRAVYGA